MTRKQKGFTLIELLIVVAIIGILAAIAIPNLLTAMQRSRQKRTMADIRSIASALEARATDFNSYPSIGQTITWPKAEKAISGLGATLTPTYIKRIPAYDGWGTEMKYGTESTAGNNYSIQSYGGDKKDDTLTQTNSGPITTQSFDCDILFSDGVFVKYPEGVQGQ